MRISDWSSDVCSSDLLDVDGRHHQAQVDRGRLQKPVQPRLVVEREGHHEQRVNETHHHDDADQRAIASAARPARARVEDVYELLAATDSENLTHARPPHRLTTLCF